LYQELLNKSDEKSFEDNNLSDICFLVAILKRNLINSQLMDKSIYERVEDEEVLKILISIKELYEKKGSNREDKSTMT